MTFRSSLFRTRPLNSTFFEIGALRFEEGNRFLIGLMEAIATSKIKDE